ncbi:phd-finger family protein [Stylonychia lemnae]|uniref:Phd-finger family protein n=1 Tax=Stylonychia lemnae TaxID=5949 RepID=A0A077ZTK0_STYLE|nr:phd-finger family protein [Stylonychia lemnae]|eukprot:CDW73243.1 phd-finger family protein [Stylonychia lemnae]
MQQKIAQPAKKKQYKKICFKDIMYETGETLIFRETESTTVVGKLVKIIPEGGNPAHPKWPMIEVQWYYKKQDLDFKKLGVSDEDQIHFGDNEVFPTNHHDKIYVDCIQEKCKVYGINEYDKLETIDAKTTFFSRAHYNPLQKILVPAFKDWEQFCVCQKPLNPNNLYIKCDMCQQWNHPRCMGMNDEEAHQTEEFYCNRCRKPPQDEKGNPSQ